MSTCDKLLAAEHRIEELGQQLEVANRNYIKVMAENERLRKIITEQLRGDDK